MSRLVRYKYLALYTLILSLILSLIETGYTQNAVFENNNEKIKSLHFKHQIDLTRIFKQAKVDKMPIPTKIEQSATIVKANLELIGTLIFGSQKQAWIKVDNQIYQLQMGQTIPGIQAQVSQIKPDSVVVSTSKKCVNSDLCNLTISIRESLF